MAYTRTLNYFNVCRQPMQYMPQFLDGLVLEDHKLLIYSQYQLVVHCQKEVYLEEADNW